MKILAFALLLTLTIPAYPCSCVQVGNDTRETLLSHEAVFVGWPTRVECIYQNGDVVAFRYDFAVSRSWKSAPHRHVSVTTPFSTCGFLFEPGRSYVITADGSSLSVGRCSPSGDEDSSAKVIAILGHPARTHKWWRTPRFNTASLVPMCLLKASGK